MRQTFTIGVVGIIRDEHNRILLVLRTDYDLWNLPGGGLEKGETPWQGVIREIKEETGLDAEVVRLAGVYSKTDVNEIIFSFECRVVGGQFTLNDEARDIRYFAIDEIPKNISRKQIQRIKDVLEEKSETVMTVQNGKSSIELLKESMLLNSLQKSET